MRKLISIILLAFCFMQAGAQSQPYTKISTWYDWYRGRFIDQLRIPKDTLATADSGSIAMKNGLVYIKNSKWDLVGGTNFTAGYGLTYASSILKVDSFLIATRARVQKVADSLAALPRVDTLYPTGTGNLNLAWRRNGTVRTLNDVFTHIGNKDITLTGDRYLTAANYEFNLIDASALFFSTIDGYNVRSIQMDATTNRFGGSLSTPSGTDGLNEAFINALSVANKKSYAQLNARWRASSTSGNITDNSVTVLPDSLVFERKIGTARTTFNWKVYGLPVGSASTDSIVVKAADGAIKVRALTDAGSATPTPNLQAVTNVGSTTTNTITAAGYLTTNNKVQIVEGGSAGTVAVNDGSGNLLSFLAGTVVGGSAFELKETTSSTIANPLYAGTLWVNSADSGYLYFRTKYGVDKKVNFGTGSGGGDPLTTTDNNLTISSNTISTKKSVQTFTDGSTITINCANGYNWKGTIAGNRTLAVTNMQEGQYLTIEINQDATGSRTITLPAGFKVINGGAGAVTLSTTGGAKDVLCIWYDGTDYLVTIGKNFN